MSIAINDEPMDQPAKSNQRKSKLPSRKKAAPPVMREVVSTSFSPKAKPVDESTADFWLHPSTAAASVIQPFSKHAMPDINCDALANRLHKAMEAGAYKDNSLAMLYGQAMALQSMFVELSRRAIRQDMLKQYEVQMRLALKAQNQCRMTLETLATVQNPPVIYAKQANFAAGHQQVNNGTSENRPVSGHAPAEKTETAQNQLLEESHGKRLDFGAQAKAGGADPLMETVGEVHRPQDSRGQGKRVAKRVQGQPAPT